MAHKIDNSKGFNAFVSHAAPAWHNLGTVMNNPISTADALRQGGIDYTVIKLPNMHYLPNGEEIISEESFFTVRTDVNKVLGSRLGKDYTVMQNVEALNVVDEILQSGTATIETAGAIDEGKKVFICLKVNKDIIVNSDDAVKQYVLIATSHDGSLSITAMPTNVRVVCNNTLTAALRDADGKIKIRHTANAANRLTEAMRIVKLLQHNTEVNAENYNTMAQLEISKAQLMDYIGNIYLNDEEIKKMQEGGQFKDVKVIPTKKQNVITAALSFASNGTGQPETFKNGNPTMWTAYNAVTGIITRDKYSDANDRANSMLFGTAARKIEEAGILAMNPAQIKPLRKSNISGINWN